MLMGTAALASCAHPVPPPPPPPPPLPPHIGPPAAAYCVVAPFKVADGGTADVAMALNNDGGYCAASLTADSGKPFDAPLEPVPPAHGVAHVVKYNGKTSVEYVPEPNYTGHDAFTVRLIVRGMSGYTTLHVAVTVEPHVAATPKS
jgi:hypothetical protein